MSNYSLSIKVDNETFKYFSVPYEVYVYVRQLEIYINNPEQSELLNLYPTRFGNKENNNL